MKLTKRQLEILQIMYHEKEELVYERGVGYVGTERVAARTVFALMRLCAISHCRYSATPGSGGLERYDINQTGIELLQF